MVKECGPLHDAKGLNGEISGTKGSVGGVNRAAGRIFTTGPPDTLKALRVSSAPNKVENDANSLDHVISSLKKGLIC